MTPTTMYENLMTLPLFKGISYTRLSEIVGATRLEFSKYTPGHTILEADAPCTHLIFILAGHVRLSTRNASGRVQVSQTLTAPAVISPDFLFGRNTFYPVSAQALDSVSVMSVAKADLLPLLQSEHIFLLNYLNLVSTNAQKAVDGMLAVTSGSLQERIAFWIIALTQMDSDDITLTARQRDMYTLFGVPRSIFFNTLDEMEAKGLLEYSAGEIRILSRRALRSLLLHQPE